MKKIKKGFIVPSAAFTIKTSKAKFWKYIEKPPEIGDVVYGEVKRLGEHSSLENVFGRIHMIHNGTKSLFVFGNRYAPDYYEGVVPKLMQPETDMLARSGLIGLLDTKNALRKDPTRIKIYGYVCDENGRVLNTRDFPLIIPKSFVKKIPRARMILVCGTSMNSGKSHAAAACCRALSTMGRNVRAAKVTGTAGLKDILLMNDRGASRYADFTYLGFPSTYLVTGDDLLHIFNSLDMKYANNPKNYWVVEFADGIIQRETAMLLHSQEVKARIHRLVFCAYDAFGAIGGLNMLRETFGLVPNAISGVCSSSPLSIKELSGFTDISVFNSVAPDLQTLAKIIL